MNAREYLEILHVAERSTIQNQRLSSFTTI